MIIKFNDYKTYIIILIYLKPYITTKDQNLKMQVFQNFLDKHNIKIIFALEHAPFVESFNKTMKNRMMKSIKLKNTDIGPK